MERSDLLDFADLTLLLRFGALRSGLSAPCGCRLRCRESFLSDLEDLLDLVDFADPPDLRVFIEGSGETISSENRDASDLTLLLRDFLSDLLSDLLFDLDDLDDRTDPSEVGGTDSTDASALKLPLRDLLLDLLDDLLFDLDDLDDLTEPSDFTRFN